MCAQCTVRPNKLKCWRLEQRKVYCKAMQGDKVAHALESLKLPKGFWQSTFKSQMREGGQRCGRDKISWALLANCKEEFGSY